MGFKWKAFGAAATLALFAVACNEVVSPTKSPRAVSRDIIGGTTVNYSGNGFTGVVLNNSFCETPQGGGPGVPAPAVGTPYLLWVLTANGATAAELHLPGGTVVPMVNVGGTFKIITGYYNSVDLIDVAFAVYSGTVSGTVKLTVSHGCPDGGGGGAKGSSVVTNVHLADHSVIDNTTLGSLGVKVHDSATVTTDGNADIPAGSKVTFHFWNNNSCNGTPLVLADEKALLLTSSPQGAASSEQGPLGAGEYSFSADFTSGDPTKVSDSEGLCEPFKIKKADTKTATQVHNVAHQNITNTLVAAPTTIHDYAAISGKVGDFTVTGSVTFKFFNNAGCTGDPVPTPQVVTVSANTESSAQTITLPGAYAYSASYGGDANYNPSGNSDCEPLNVAQLGKTMGFWGNTNGIALIGSNGGYAGLAVNIGRTSGGADGINTQAEAQKIFPNSLNACGKGTPTIFNNSASANCTLASGLNISTLNNSAAQTLALWYNRKIIVNYEGQTIGGLGCSSFLTSPLTALGVGLSSTSSVSDVFTVAKAFIDASASSAASQANLGALNSLAGCLNRETI
jgi:hypothetical protein